ncbi:MAG: fatty acid desaturase [Williamsia sp.]|nr:fatty acid desaturase [Williamsia sp.]
MSFIENVLDPPSYGWKDIDGSLYKPTNRQIWKEFFSRINVFKTRKNWLPFFSWFSPLCFLPLIVYFLINLFRDFHFGLVVAVFVYSMILMGTHGTIWYHRYCTHKAYVFRNQFWRFITQNLVIKVVPEELYVVSHHVHHCLSDQPGDPYNAQAGFLYCFLADANHQPIAKNLSEEDYNRAVKFLQHTGVPANTYQEYLKWGSIASPWKTALSTVLNWVFWYGVFYLLGGPVLAAAMFTAAFIWALGVRTFNYEGHGKGKDKRKEGTDYNENDMSINQLWPGIVAGEWHNNHHLYPVSARSGFLRHQVDLAWYYIKLLSLIGGVSSYHDSKKQFIQQYRKPFLEKKHASVTEQKAGKEIRGLS